MMTDLGHEIETATADVAAGLGAVNETTEIEAEKETVTTKHTHGRGHEAANASIVSGEMKPLALVGTTKSGSVMLEKGVSVSAALMQNEVENGSQKPIVQLDIKHPRSLSHLDFLHFSTD